MEIFALSLHEHLPKYQLKYFRPTGWHGTPEGLARHFRVPEILRSWL